jgi:hypothetical protein
VCVSDTPPAGVSTWMQAAACSPAVSGLLIAAGLDDRLAIDELARLRATDEALVLRLLRDDVGIVPLGPRLRLVAALRLWR